MSLTRRTVLAAAPAAAAATSLGGPTLAQGQAPATASAGQASTAHQAPGFYRYKVGDIEVTAVHDGVAPRPLEGLVRNAELSDVQKAMREAFLPTDQLPITFTPLVLRTGDRLVLIDTGNGDMGAPTSGTWMANFQAAGFDPARVSTIIISHFHGDHINGLRRRDGTAVFPNAEITVPAAEWAFWMDDANMNQAPEGLKPTFQGARRVFGPMIKDVTQYESGKTIVPGVTTVAAPGHTPGHTVFMIESGNSRVMMMSDTTNHPALFVRNPDWAAVFDVDGEQARQTRRRLLDMAAAERAQVAFYHAPFPATGYIDRDGQGFRFVPVQWSPVI